jgi:GTP-binding protein EngB required for normal cell division
MTATIARIQSDIERLREFLQSGSLLSFSGEERASLRSDLAELEQKLTSVQAGFLTLGILGGSGVGKSTMMNALAGQEIASISHRRPHTNHVLIYKHESAGPLPALGVESPPWHVISHQGDAIKHVLLCDLPDFDSLMGEHREQVLRFLEHLDVLIWVTSLEKYGDSRFYEFLRMVPKAEQNFIFVLNKIDLLFPGESAEKAYDNLNHAITSFHGYIGDQGMTDPLLYALSCAEVVEKRQPSPWNQFPAFRRHVFLQRDTKQLLSIKAANLEVEACRLLSALERETRDLERFIKVLDEATAELTVQKRSWSEGPQSAVDSWLDGRIRAAIMSHQQDPTWLVGPGYGIALVLQTLQGRSGEGREETADLTELKPPQETVLSYRKRFEWTEEHLAHIIRRENLPPGFMEKAKETIRGERRFEDLGERFLSAVLSFVVQPAPTLKGFKIYQCLIYALLFMFFVLAVGGQKAWLDFLGDPGISKGLQLLITIIRALFSSKGLAALGSYALLNLFLGFRFYRRYRRLLLRSARKTLAVLKFNLSGIWDVQLDDLVQDLQNLRRETASRLDMLSSLHQERGLTKAK